MGLFGDDDRLIIGGGRLMSVDVGRGRDCRSWWLKRVVMEERNRGEKMGG